MTVCQELVGKGEGVTVAVEGTERTLWLNEKEGHYVVGILKSN